MTKDKDKDTAISGDFRSAVTKDKDEDKDTGTSGDFRSAVTKNKDKDTAISGEFGNLRHSSFSRDCGGTLIFDPERDRDRDKTERVYLWNLHL